VTAPALAPGTGGTAEADPVARVAEAIRRDITYGHIPPGGYIDAGEYASRYNVGPHSVHKALKVIQGENSPAHSHGATTPPRPQIHRAARPRLDVGYL